MPDPYNTPGTLENRAQQVQEEALRILENNPHPSAGGKTN